MDNVDFVRFALAFVFVLGLIGGMSLLLKRYLRTNNWLGAQQNSDRLHLIQTRYIDAKRKLVLVKCDDKEHLLLLSDGREMIIESGMAAQGDKSQNA